MDFSVDMSCEMKVNNSCELCHRKVSEVMQCLTAYYSVTYLGDKNLVKLKARANPNVIMWISLKYGDHGKISNFHMDGQPVTPVTPQPGVGYYGPSGYNNLPSTGPGGYYPYPSPYAPPPQFLAGNYGYPMPNPPPPQKETPQGMNKQHTAPPSYAIQPPPPMPLSSYSYIEPPYWPMSRR